MRIAHGEVTFGVMADLRTIGNAHAEVFNGRPHETDVPAPGNAVGVNFPLGIVVTERGVACGVSEIGTLFQISLSILQRGAEAHAELFAQLEGKVRVDVDRLNVGGNAAVGLIPVAVVFGTHAERNRHAETEPDGVVDLMNEVAVRNHFGLVAAVGRRAVFTGIVKVEADAHEAELDGRALVQDHRGRVVVNAREVGAVDAGAGIGATEGTGGLFGKHEARGVSRRGKGGSYGDRGERDFESSTLHGSTPWISCR